ncbi:HNH endonuclease signature motif containing protein [Tomitella biformata]|uniref:HNH endonuclease signature motif containing protein n=1 Tax=Tomitella biformata TaxID=630403 RepID=UPI000464BC60|nr:HNH endonuclease signature motif containing protein [Tomitella biformata]
MGYCREVLERLGTVVSTGLQTLPDAVRDDLVELDRMENRATAQRLLKTAALADFRMKCLRTLGVSEHLLREIAITDIAIATTCTETVATTYLKIGEMLTHRTPKITDAFLAGDLNYRRVAAISSALDEIEKHTIAAIEDELLAAARKLTPGPLLAEIERILIAHDPDLAAHRHQVGKARRRTRRRNAPFGMAWFEAFLTADEAINLEAMIDEVAATVCEQDPRNAGQRRADAFLALTRGEHAIPCRCGRDACPHFLQTTHQPRNKPHVYVHADLATLMQLANNPAVLAGYGPICPDYARMLAEDATWQLLINEGKRLAEHWQTINPGDQEDEDSGGFVDPPAESAPPASTPPESDVADNLREDLPVEEDPEYEDYLEQQYTEYCSREKLAEQHRATAMGTALPANTRMLLGRSRPAPPIPLAAWYRRDQIRCAPRKSVIGDGTIINRILMHLEHHPADAAGIHPDGHGGFEHPPDGALTYRPTAAQKALVRARDGHCRFPACTRPAKRCEIDHRVPFNQNRPRAGGWTIESNLQCLCKHHHQLKTARTWTVVGLAGSALIWTSITGHVQITLPAGFRTTVAPPNIHLDRTPLPPIERPAHLRAEKPPPPEPDPRDGIVRYRIGDKINKGDEYGSGIDPPPF